MWPMPIKDFVKMSGTRAEAARALGVSRPTVSLWITRGRNIFVLPGKDGPLTYYEVKAAA